VRARLAHRAPPILSRSRGTDGMDSTKTHKISRPYDICPPGRSDDHARLGRWFGRPGFVADGAGFSLPGAVATSVIVDQFLCHPGDVASPAPPSGSRRWTYPCTRPGRPSTRKDIGDAVLWLARENLSWGYVRISDDLAGVGVRVPPGTVGDILKRVGSGVAPRRNGLCWRQ
jgi:hypothetical protein